MTCLPSAWRAFALASTLRVADSAIAAMRAERRGRRALWSVLFTGASLSAVARGHTGGRHARTALNFTCPGGSPTLVCGGRIHPDFLRLPSSRLAPCEALRPGGGEKALGSGSEGRWLNW